jgi:Bacterial low temperature requirement A protein (LtrA)
VPISWPIIVASVLGIAITASLWWAYFDVLALGVERTLRRLRGTARASLAIHAYTYLHLPLIGIKRRGLGTISWIRLGAVVLLGVLIPVAAHVPALAAFVILAAVCVTVVAVETRVWADDRRELRDAVVAEQTEHHAEADEAPAGH